VKNRPGDEASYALVLAVDSAVLYAHDVISSSIENVWHTCAHVFLKVLRWMQDLEWWHANSPYTSDIIFNLLSLSREDVEILFITHLTVLEFPTKQLSNLFTVNLLLGTIAM